LNRENDDIPVHILLANNAMSKEKYGILYSEHKTNKILSKKPHTLKIKQGEDNGISIADFDTERDDFAVKIVVEGDGVDEEKVPNALNGKYYHINPRLLNVIHSKVYKKVIAVLASQSNSWVNRDDIVKKMKEYQVSTIRSYLTRMVQSVNPIDVLPISGLVFRYKNGNSGALEVMYI
jgi:hypothetical protein